MRERENVHNMLGPKSQDSQESSVKSPTNCHISTPVRGLEPATLQIFQKQGKFDLNTITTWPRRPLLEGASNLNIGQYSTKFHYLNTLKSIFGQFAPQCTT